MSFLAALNVGAGIAGALFGSSAEAKRRSALIAGRDRGNAEWNDSYDDISRMNAPAVGYGNDAMGRLDQASQGDYSGFKKSLDYDFRRNEGMRDVGNHFSARGGGGNAMKALAEFNSGLAAGEYGNWWNRQSGIADRGQNAVARNQNARTNTASGISNNEMMAAQGIGQSHSNQGAIMNNAMTSTIGNHLYGNQRGYWGGGQGGVAANPLQGVNGNTSSFGSYTAENSNYLNPFPRR